MSVRSLALRALDALVAVPVGLFTLAERALALLSPAPRARRRARLMVIDSAYTLHVIRTRRLERFLDERDLGGFFEHVWTVHPLIGASPDEPPENAFGPPRVERLSATNTFVSGPIGRYPILARLPWTNFILAQRALLKVAGRIAREEGIAVVRAHDPFVLAIVGRIVARAARLPLMVFLQGNYDYLYASTGALAYPRLLRSRKLEQRIARWALRHADAVAGANQNNLDYGLQNGARPERSVLLRIGRAIDPHHFVAPSARASVPESAEARRPFVVYVGRLLELKHPDDVVRAVAVAIRMGGDLDVVLVGDGPMREQIVTLAKELGIADRLVLMGNRDQVWLSRFLPHAAAVASPLTGRALVEAALAGAPLVAYDVEWHRELVKDSETGLLVPYRDVEAFGAALARVVRDPALGRRLGESGRAFAMRLMDPEALTAHERAVYEWLMRRRAERPLSPEERDLGHAQPAAQVHGTL